MFRTVTKAEFWDYIMSTHRNLHPRSEPDRSLWIDQRTYETIGISTPGYRAQGDETYQLLEGEGWEAPTMSHYTATYSPDDNKLRLYAILRLDPETYAKVKAAGFRWAPKQDLFVAPAWTPEREDLLLELCEGEIGDEDTSLVARAETRAERFEEYSDKREAEADAANKRSKALADAMNGQPILVGHHSEKRHRRDLDRMWSDMGKACKLWRTSEYWTERAKGAIRHAKYKERPDVRARRIKGLEADLRKVTKRATEREGWIKLWSAEGLTLARARTLANYGHGYVAAEYTHPSGYVGPLTAYDALKDDPPMMTPEEVRDKVIANMTEYSKWDLRWAEHYTRRLEYERALLAEDGGIVTDQTGPAVGGAVKCWASPRGGWSFIVKVNKVSVTVWDNWGNGGENFTRTIPFDKLAQVMTPAEVEAAKAEEKLKATADGIGFILL